MEAKKYIPSFRDFISESVYSDYYENYDYEEEYKMLKSVYRELSVLVSEKTMDIFNKIMSKSNFLIEIRDEEETRIPDSYRGNCKYKVEGIDLSGIVKISYKEGDINSVYTKNKGEYSIEIKEELLGELLKKIKSEHRVEDKNMLLLLDVMDESDLYYSIGKYVSGIISSFCEIADSAIKEGMYGQLERLYDSVEYLGE